MTSRPDAIVVGAGVAGLAASWDLRARGLRVVVIDPNDTPGGHARTTREDNGFVWEWGPHTLTSSATTILDLAHEAGVADEIVAPEGPGTRYIYRNGAMHALPRGPGGVFRSRVLSKRGWLRIFAEPLTRSRGHDTESVHDFFARRIGPEAAEVLVGSFVSGIHAGDPHRLGIADAFPTLARWERDHGSLFRGAMAMMRSRRKARTATDAPRRRGLATFRGGMGTLTAALAAPLGDDLHLGRAVTRVARSDDGWTVHAGRRVWRAPRLVIATPPHVAARLLEPLDAEAATLLAGVGMSPVAVVHLMGTDRRGVPEGFGVLVPRGEGIRTLGVLFVANHVPGRLPDDGWILTAILGGATDPDILHLPSAEIVARATADITTMTGYTPRPHTVRAVQHAAAIPQMRPGHLARMATVAERLAAFPGLALAGNYTLGVSVDHAARSGRRAAATVVGDASPKEAAA